MYVTGWDDEKTLKKQALIKYRPLSFNNAYKLYQQLHYYQQLEDQMTFLMSS